MSQLSQKKTPVKLDDKQSERDTRELRIDKVGVRGLRFPIQVRDKARSVRISMIDSHAWSLRAGFDDEPLRSSLTDDSYNLNRNQSLPGALNNYK